MDRLERMKIQYRSFSGKRGFPLLLMTIGVAICLTMVILSRYRPPLDPLKSGVFGADSVTLSDRERQSVVMEQDASAMELVVYDYQKTYNLYISSGTVADALDMAGITLGEFDEISIDDAAQISDGMEIHITRVSVEQEYEYEAIPYETVRQASDSLLVNVEKLVQSGEDGQREYTYDIIYKNGIRTARILAQTSVVKKPINEIISYGTASYYRPNMTYEIDEETGTITLSDGIVLHFKDKIEVSATAYTTEGQDFKITYSGATARYGIIAVDPRVIPLGTEMFVVGTSGMWTYGYCIAGDIGGFIKGNRIDLFYNTENECKNFGRRGAIVYILSGNE